jgi:YidC/Oxa1 family membrane protein insertase
VLIVLYVGSQVASTLIATATADPNQRRLMLALPIIFVIILYRYPAGLLVYWITTNLWTIGQQYLIRRHMGPLTPPAAKEGDAKPRSMLRPALAGAGGGGGGAAARGSGSDAKAEKGPTKAEKGSKDGGATATKPKSAPPPPPRKRKKRSGRRR